MNGWLEVVLIVLFALVTWLACAVILARLEESPASGEGRPSRPDAPTGTGSAQGPSSYRDAYTDHRDHGDEDPPRYRAVEVTCARRGCGGTMVRARDGDRCNKCGRLLGSRMSVERPYGLPPGHKPIFDKTLGIAPPAHQRVERKRDGIQLSDEANADLLKDIFGDTLPG